MFWKGWSRLQPAAFRAGNGQRKRCARAQLQPVTHIGKDHQRIEQVIAVGAAPRDMQGEVDLGRCQPADKAGGYAIQGLAGCFVVKLTGSYTNVVGLPLQETVSLLVGEGYPVHFNWVNG